MNSREWGKITRHVRGTYTQRDIAVVDGEGVVQDSLALVEGHYLVIDDAYSVSVMQVRFVGGIPHLVECREDDGF